MNLQDIYAQPSIPEPKHKCFQQCSCGKEYTEEQWMNLKQPPSGGIWDFGDGSVLILRNCSSCNSTAGVEKMKEKTE